MPGPVIDDHNNFKLRGAPVWPPYYVSDPGSRQEGHASRTTACVWFARRHALHLHVDGTRALRFWTTCSCIKHSSNASIMGELVRPNGRLTPSFDKHQASSPRAEMSTVSSHNTTAVRPTRRITARSRPPQSHLQTLSSTGASTWWLHTLWRAGTRRLAVNFVRRLGHLKRPELVAASPDPLPSCISVTKQLAHRASTAPSNSQQSSTNLFDRPGPFSVQPVQRVEHAGPSHILRYSATRLC